MASECLADGIQFEQGFGAWHIVLILVVSHRAVVDGHIHGWPLEKITDALELESQRFRGAGVDAAAAARAIRTDVHIDMGGAALDLDIKFGWLW